MSAPRAAIFAVGGAVLAALSWSVIGLGWAEHFAERAPARALALRGSDPEAHVRQALGLADKQPAEAAKHARAALRLRPLDGRAYRVLSAAAPTPDATHALLEIAVARAPRDVPGHALLARHALERGDAADAIAHFDSMLRVEPQVFPSVYPVLQAMASSPDAHDALAGRLASRPPWRGALLSNLARTAPDMASFAPLYARLAAVEPLDDRELVDWLNRLVRDREFGVAYLTWIGTLPAERKLTIGNIYDGGFEGEPSGMGFDWRFGRVPGARIERVRHDGASSDNAALHVEFAHRRVLFKHVRQMLALPAGPYRVSGRARLEGLDTERGLVWTVTCVEGGKPIGESEPFSGTQAQWRPFAFPVEVPAEKCGAQWLTLRLPARIAAEQRIGGGAWFDDLAAKREPVRGQDTRPATPIPRKSL